ncbi:hypothetical protein ACSBR2_007242 [Camellia fascicularis]
MSKSQRFQLGTVGALTLLVASSVLIVICNKAFITALSFNFVCTKIMYSSHLPLCSYDFDKLASSCHILFSSCGLMDEILLLNLSLCFNSVGFYQMTKLAIIPCTVLLETLFFSKKFNRRIQLSLSILLLGVGIATVTDLQLNIMGSILSLLAVVTTCVAQIMTNTIQKKFKVSSTQLLYQSCPYQATTLFFAGPFLYRLLTNQNVFIVLSCLIAVSVNFSTFLVIGKTSPVMYQAFGYVLLHDPFSWRNIFGIVIALVGMVLYSYYCTLESQQKATEVLPQTSQAKEGESDRLMSARKV